MDQFGRGLQLVCFSLCYICYSLVLIVMRIEQGSLATAAGAFRFILETLSMTNRYWEEEG